jgi:putative lipoprotein
LTFGSIEPKVRAADVLPGLSEAVIAPLRAILVFLAALGLSACAQQSGSTSAAAASAAVTGTVTYLQRMALTPDAIVMVRLEDVSRADAPTQLIGEQDIATEGRQVPVPFEIRYDPKAIDPSHTYAVSAQIVQGERLLFVTDTQHPVITRGNPSTVEILVKPAS